MSSELKQSVTTTIMKLKTENKKDIRTNAGLATAGLAVGAIAVLLFPPSGVVTMLTTGAGLMFISITQGLSFFKNAGHNETLRAAETEAAGDASVPETMARGATHMKTARTADRWTLRLLALGLGVTATATRPCQHCFRRDFLRLSPS